MSKHCYCRKINKVNDVQITVGSFARGKNNCQFPYCLKYSLMTWGKSLLLVGLFNSFGLVSAERCVPGETKQVDCNRCRCLADGKGFACTRRFCLPEERHGHRAKRQGNKSILALVCKFWIVFLTKLKSADQGK